METLEGKIREIGRILLELSVKLDTLNDANFDAVMAEFNAKTRKIDVLKLQLKADYDLETLRKFEPGLLKLTKQLSNKFDNIITKVKTEKDAVALELKNIQNKKKLANYNR